MEQTNQQITQKPSLPIKTKIAAWWMIVAGGCEILFGFVTFRSLLGLIFLTGTLFGFEAIIGVIVSGVLYVISGISLLKRKRWSWCLSIFILFISSIISILNFSSRIDGKVILEFSEKYLLFFIIPFILLLLDRKNFWKIAN